MFSAIRGTISGALSSFPSFREPIHPKRLSSDISTQSDDPAILPLPAHMPYSRSTTYSNTDTKRRKGAKATEFLNEHFNPAGNDDDPIETSFPPEARVRRRNSVSRPTAGKREEPGPNSIRPNTIASKPERTHQYLKVDPEVRSLFAGNAPPDLDAYYIKSPSLTTSNLTSSSSSMRPKSFLRPIDTLENAKNSQAPIGPRNRFQEPRRGQSGNVGSNTHTSVSKAGHPTRNGTGEPPLKRRRVEDTSQPYVTIEGVGAVSPMFSSTANGDHVMTKSDTSKVPVTKQNEFSKNPMSGSIALDEYQYVEKTMQTSHPKRSSGIEISSHFATRPLIEHRQWSEESDPEKFTRDSKRARLQLRADGSTESSPNTHQPAERSSEGQDIIITPPSIIELFTESMLPNEEHAPSCEPSEPPEDPSASEAAIGHTAGRTTRDMRIGSDASAIQTTGHRLHTVAKSVPSKRFKARAQNSNSGVGSFPLHYLNYGFLPENGSYLAKVSENLLRIYDTKSTLSRDPIWPPIQLSKVLKVYHGSDDCWKLMLQMSLAQGQPSNTIRLELRSKEDNKNFLALLPDVTQQTLWVMKDDDWLCRCFEHNTGADRGNQQEKPVNVRHQPISNQRQIPGTTSPHFWNQQATSTNNLTRPSKLTSRLQSSSSTSRFSGADSRIPTVISGSDKANRSSATSGEQISTTLAKNHTFDQDQPLDTSRLRSSLGRTPVTRSSHKAGMFTSESGKTQPRRKYSETHGFGDPWKNPLLYPKTGKRRMAVEYGDLYRLDEDEFLNDNLIGFFLRYLEYYLEQTNPELAKKVYFYNSYFFERLMQISKDKKGVNYKSVQKWTRSVDIFDCDFVVVPVNENFHWYVVIICNLSKLSTLAWGQGEGGEPDILASKKPAVTSKEAVVGAEETSVSEGAHDQPTEKTTQGLSHLSLSDDDRQADELAPPHRLFKSQSSPRPRSTPKKSGPGRRKGARHSLPKYNISAPIIMTFDSLGAPRSSTCTALRQYIVEEAKSRKGWDLDGNLIKGMTAKGIPTQSNYSDCGLYLCAYLEKFILGPAAFVGRILQREMDPTTDMPMMASEELRSRMRGLIMELHNEQEGEVTELSVPDIGRILLAPPRDVSPDNVPCAPRTSPEDDSEDELQRDQTTLSVLKVARSPPIDTPAPPGEPAESPMRSPAGAPEKAPQSQAAMLMLDMLDKVNATASSPFNSNSKSGTRETAISIDDDEDAPTILEAIPTQKIKVRKDAFLQQPSDLEATFLGSKTSTPTETPLARRRRSQSIASADTVNTDFLSGSGHKSYQHEGKKRVTTIRAEHPRPEIVVLIPDSQESREEGEMGGVEGERPEEESQVILEGVE